ncbi:hypothetical protein KOW79_013199 [Hemibagrus wyckioides]|uniref:Uncharacterized protein n=1 Tax=Hemibagrus wyckioides TaxID=337641 RepID=A0A9D3SGL1_9TELE|nr:hypothetical protein KOW79_013199 [Hemibagrus wyckioides]
MHVGFLHAARGTFLQHEPTAQPLHRSHEDTLTSAVQIVNVNQDFIARPQVMPTLNVRPVREEQGVAVETKCVVLETSVAIMCAVEFQHELQQNTLQNRRTESTALLDA